MRHNRIRILLFPLLGLVGVLAARSYYTPGNPPGDSSASKWNPNISRLGWPNESTALVNCSNWVSVAGTVRSETGDPLNGAMVALGARGYEPTRTDSQGSFLIPEVSPKHLKFGVCAFAPGYALGGSDLAKVSEGDLRVDIILRPEEKVSGKVLTREGQPVAGVSISISYREAPGEQLPHWKANFPLDNFGLAESTTDREGGFEFGALWGGLWQLQVRRGPILDGRLIASRLVPSGESGVVIRVADYDKAHALTPGEGMAVFSGRIVDSMTGTPISDARVTPSFHGQGFTANYPDRAVGSDSNGIFKTDHLVSGSWQLSIQADGYVEEKSREIEIPALGKTPDFQLGTPLDVSITLLDSRDNLVGFAVFDALGLNGGRLAHQTVEPLGISRKGKLVLSGIPRGDVVFLVSPPGCDREFRFPVDLRSEGSKDVELRLPADFSSPRKKVSVTLRNRRGESLSESFRLEAIDAAGVPVASWQVHFDEGSFRVSPGHPLSDVFDPRLTLHDSVVPFEMPPGEFQVSAEGKNWVVASSFITVGSGIEPPEVKLIVE